MLLATTDAALKFAVAPCTAASAVAPQAQAVEAKKLTEALCEDELLAP
jgi:hypothetical protein